MDEDDWEGVETSVLEDTFNDAAILVASSVVGRGTKLTQDLQLQLYGLYKQATEGPCKDNAPSVFNLKAKAKWFVLYLCFLYDLYVILLGMNPQGCMAKAWGDEF